MPDCDDKVNHTYAGPCHADRAPCCHRHDGHAYLVCDNCHDDTQALLNLLPGGANFDRLGHPRGYTPTPPSAPAGNPPAWNGSAHPLVPPPNPPFPGFLTRVCRSCERHLQSLRHVYHNGTMLPPADHAQMRSFPQNTCTCRHTLGVNGIGPRRCFGHRRLLWQALEDRKNRNDIWLRNTERTPSGQIVQASNATKALRRAVGSINATWRGCRCGRTCEQTPWVAGPGMQEVWLCMACEGYMSRILPTAAASMHSGHLITSSQLLRQKHRLGRRRNDGTI